MIENILKKINENKDLTYDETKQVFTDILANKATSEQIDTLITNLGSRKETAAEIAGMVDVFNAYSSNRIQEHTSSKNFRKDYSNSLNF